MPCLRDLSFLCVLGLATVGCGSKATEPPPPPPPPTVQSVTVSPATAALASIGETTTLTAEIRLSNGATGNQAVTWSTSSAAVSVASGLVTALANGEATVTATVGSVGGSAVVRVAQVVASVSVLPADTVIKSVARLRGAALDARGNPVANAPLQWQAVTPQIANVDQAGNLAPQATGVARVRLSSGTLTATALVRTVWNVAQLGTLFPLFEYTATTGQRRAISDVSQAHADARAAVMGPLWSYLATVLPTSGSDATDMYFTTWPEIWVEFIPFCGGQFSANQINWTACAAPNQQHFFIPTAQQPNDHDAIVRFLARQWVLASHTASRQIPWFVEGFAGWLSGGSNEPSGSSGKPPQVSINDFKAGDLGSLLAPLDTLMRLPSDRYYENLPQRTPVAVRNAQGVMLASYLATASQSSALCQILGAIRTDPGAGFTNDELIQLILTATGQTAAQLEAAYLAHARAIAGGTAAVAAVVPVACTP